MPSKEKKTKDRHSYSPYDYTTSSDDEPRSPDEVNHKEYSRDHSPHEEYTYDYSSSDEEYNQKFQRSRMKDLINHLSKQLKRHPRKKRNRKKHSKKECSSKHRKPKRSRASSKAHSPQRKYKKRRKHSTKPKPKPTQERKRSPESPSTPSIDCDSKVTEPVPDPEIPLPTAPTTLPAPTVWTLRAKLPNMHTGQRSEIIKRLHLIPQVTEITIEETTGEPKPQTTLRIKGKDSALYDAQNDLEIGGYNDVTWQEHRLPPSTASTPDDRRTTLRETPRSLSPYCETHASNKNTKYARDKTKADRISRKGIVKAIMDDKKYGFIRTECDEDLFVLPSACVGFPDPNCDGRYKIPPVGTKVIFEISPDAKTGRNKAILVAPDEDRSRAPRKSKHQSSQRPIGA